MNNGNVENQERCLSNVEKVCQTYLAAAMNEAMDIDLHLKELFELWTFIDEP